MADLLFIPKAGCLIYAGALKRTLRARGFWDKSWRIWQGTYRAGEIDIMSCTLCGNSCRFFFVKCVACCICPTIYDPQISCRSHHLDDIVFAAIYGTFGTFKMPKASSVCEMRHF